MDFLTKLKKRTSKILFFPAKLVHCVMYYFFFLQMNKGTHGGSVGPTIMVQTCLMMIIVHLLFAIFGYSFWQFCLFLGDFFKLDDKTQTAAFGIYLLSAAILPWRSINKVTSDNAIEEMAFIHSTWKRKIISVVLFFVFLIGTPLLTFFVAMYTVEPWY